MKNVVFMKTTVTGVIFILVTIKLVSVPLCTSGQGFLLNPMDTILYVGGTGPGNYRNLYMDVPKTASVLFVV